MTKVETFTFPSSNQKNQIAARAWLPDGTPRGVLQISHGVGEHIGRYGDFAQFLTEQGFVVLGNDHLGHGLSVDQENHLGHLAPGEWQHAVADIHCLCCQGKKRFCDLPYFLLGHSMGSFLVRTYLIQYPGGLDGVILSGTGQMPAPLVKGGHWLAQRMKRRLGPNGRSQALDKLCFGAYNKRFAPNRTPSDWISRDEAVVDAFIQDPLCGGVPTTSLFCEMLGALRFLADVEHLAPMDRDMPVLFFSGEQDPVGEQGKGVKRVYRSFLSIGCNDVTLHLYPEGRHEMLNELNRGQVYQDVLTWLEQHVVS